MSAQALKAVATGREIEPTSSFNSDAWHAMQTRDDQLIKDSILHGHAGKEYVYEFSISGQKVTGVSVVGARELASHYGGIKHRIVASVDKTGSLFVFKSFEPLAVQANIIPQLADEEDFYEVVIEISDLKTGNSIQVRKKETKVEKRKNGSSYERPHFDVIAESKAYRNGVLSIIPQDVIKEFETRCLRNGSTGNEKTLDQLREGSLAFGAKNGISIDRQAINSLTYAELYGLGSAAGAGKAVFLESAESLGIVRSVTKPEQTDPDDQALRQIEQAQPTGGFQPTADEIAAIKQRDMAEAQGKQPEPPRQRRERGSMNVD